MPKKTLKPLMSVKHDFVDALDNFTHQTILLLQVTRSLLDKELVPGIPASIRAILKERHEAVEVAFLSNENND